MVNELRTVFKGSGIYVPPNRVDNQMLSNLMETSDEWIRKRTGIVTRYYADQDQASSDLAVPAARMALERAGMEPEEIEYVVFATMTPDYYFPGSGPIFQDKMGLPHVPCLDIRQQCSGFLYGLQVADALLRSRQYRNVLVVGSEVHGCFMPWESWDVALGHSTRKVDDDEYARNTLFRDRTVLFGDAAGAFVLTVEEGNSRGLEDIAVHADGAAAQKMWVPGGGSSFRPYFSPEMFERGDTVPVVEGREVFRTAVTLMPEAVESILNKNDYTIEDIDLLIMHQANLRINEAVQKRLGLPDEKVYNNIQEYGNTTSATLPLTYHEADEAKLLGPGRLVCFVALGGGLTWGAALYRC